MGEALPVQDNPDKNVRSVDWVVLMHQALDNWKDADGNRVDLKNMPIEDFVQLYTSHFRGRMITRSEVARVVLARKQDAIRRGLLNDKLPEGPGRTLVVDASGVVITDKEAGQHSGSGTLGEIAQPQGTPVNHT